MPEPMQTCVEPVTLERLVHQRIHQRTGGRIRHLRVLLADGKIVVSGNSQTYYMKQLALVAASEALKEKSLAFVLNIDVD